MDNMRAELLTAYPGEKWQRRIKKLTPYQLKMVYQSVKQSELEKEKNNG